MNTLELIESARQSLALFETFGEAMDYRGSTLAVEREAKRRGLLEIQNKYAESRLWVERHMGEMLAEMEMNKGGQAEHESYPLPDVRGRMTLLEIGISYRQSSNFQKMFAIDEARFVEHITRVKDTGGELTTLGVLLLAQVNAHVRHNTGEYEWYTPPAFAEAARAVLGAIDLDPASTPEANEIIRAERIYTKEDDGLAHAWRGRVFLNPPYGTALIGAFTDKLVHHYDVGEVAAAVVLVNNGTETAWFQRLGSAASALCFPAGRIAFLDAEMEPALSPLQGQVLLYFGGRSSDMDFHQVFSAFGLTIVVGP